jgi:Glu-tRNA(Gln) amidotransferase subunit E-like FAD-binding protein
MSGNIHDTNTSLIRKDVDDLLEELQGLKQKKINLKNYLDSNSEDLKKKYSNLYNTSNTLFKFIISQYDTDKFDRDQFNNTLSILLSNIENIQKSKKTQHDASVEVGSILANKYIPKELYEKK